MIVDSLKNIDIYKNISQDIYLGLQFIQNAKPDIAFGDYQLSDKVKAMVTEYETVAVFEKGFEAHKKNIDIQYPIIGRERIKWVHIAKTIIHRPYDEVMDRAFYNSVEEPANIDVGNGIFAVFFPDDAHGPTCFVDKPEMIKKITIKVLL